MSTGPRGVDGWLLLLVFGLTFVPPLQLVRSAFMPPEMGAASDRSIFDDQRWPRYRHVNWGISIASAGLGVVAGLRLWKVHRRSSVHFAILALWIVMPIAALLDGVAVWAIYGPVDAAVFLPETMKEAMLSTLKAGIWTGYLLLSKRVRNTYVTE